MTDNPTTEPWGHIEDGVWRPLPMAPLAGLGPPPFDIEIRAGVVRTVVVRPESDQVYDAGKSLTDMV